MMNSTNAQQGDSGRGPRLSAEDKRQRNTYLREFLPAIVTFWILLAIVQSSVDETTSRARLWVLLPVLPMIGVAVALYRATQRADEYGRIVMLECMALGFAVSMIASMALGFLGMVGVAWTYGGWLVFGVGTTAWGLALVVRNLD